MNKITEEYIKDEMMKYDFLKYSVKNFVRVYGVSESYVHKKVREYKLPYKYRKNKLIRNKDRFGRFTFKQNIENIQEIKEIRQPVMRNENIEINIDDTDDISRNAKDICKMIPKADDKDIFTTGRRRIKK